MAAGTRSIKLTELSIKLPVAGNVIAQIQWQYRVEDTIGGIAPVTGGSLDLDLGTSAAALAMTLGQIRTSALAALDSAPSVPPRDVVS
jgi:hypothetical protein